MSTTFSSIFPPSLAINTSEVNNSNSNNSSLNSGSAHSTTHPNFGVGGSFEEEFSLGLSSPVKLDDNTIPSILLDTSHHGHNTSYQINPISQLSTPPTDATFGDLVKNAAAAVVSSSSATTDADFANYFKLPASSHAGGSSGLFHDSGFYVRPQQSNQHQRLLPQAYTTYNGTVGSTHAGPPSPALSTRSDTSMHHAMAANNGGSSSGGMGGTHFLTVNAAMASQSMGYQDFGTEITPTRFLAISDLDEPNVSIT
jgi:hypothetical protein